jgi:hypothetical protein
MNVASKYRFFAFIGVFSNKLLSDLLKKTIAKAKKEVFNFQKLKKLLGSFYAKTDAKPTLEMSIRACKADYLNPSNYTKLLPSGS